jgi:hypothetical protein
MLAGLLPQQIANVLLELLSGGDGDEVSPYGSTITMASGPVKFGVESAALTVGSTVTVLKSAKGRTPADDDGASSIHSADSKVEAYFTVVEKIHPFVPFLIVRSQDCV